MKLTWPSIVNLILVAVVLVYVGIALTGSLAFEEGPVSDQVGDVLWFSLLCGVAASATIEVFKRIFQIRGWFQDRATRAWLLERSGKDEGYAQLLDAMGLSKKEQARRDAVLRVFNLPTEQLAAQVSAAADVALSDRERYEQLIAGLTGDRAGADDLARAEAVGQRVRTGVDQLQISLGERWRRQVQASALWISGAFGILLIEGAGVGAQARFVLAALLIGGLFAWTLRDLAAVVERSRR